jgi:hypothetical protein
VTLPWTDDVPEPERDLDELRAVVAHRAGRLRNRRRLGLVSGAAALVAVLVMLATLPGDTAKPRRLQAANQPDTSTTIDPSSDGTIDPSEVYGEEPTTTVPGQTTSTTAKRRAVAPSPTTVPTEPFPDTCPHTAGTSLSSGETKTAATGAWVACRPGSPFGTGEVGLELRADGRWSKLVRGANGALQRKRNWDNEGSWAVPDQAASETSMSVQVDGGGGTSMWTTFSPDHLSMRLNNMGSHFGEYTRVPPGTAITDVPDTGDSECTKGEGPERKMTSKAQYEAAVTHLWVYCQPHSVFLTDAPGLEIRSDGQWFELDRRADGVFVRSSGRLHGTWEAMDTSSMNGPNSWQLNLTTTSGSSGGGYVQFATYTSKIRFPAYTDAGPTDLVYAPAGAQVVDG